MHMTAFGWIVLTVGLVMIVGLSVGAALFFTKTPMTATPVIVEEQMEVLPVEGTTTEVTATTTP